MGLLDQILYLWQKDPAIIAGLFLLASSQLFVFRLHARMKSIGDQSYSLFKPINDALWKLPLAYLRARPEHSWSPWPVYLMASCFIFGLGLLIIGLIRL